MSSKKKPSGVRRGAKSKYTPEVVDAICRAIAEHGGCEAGWVAGNIAKGTFFEWKNKYPEFSDRIAQAEKQYAENCPQVQKLQAKKAFADYLFGRVEEVWTSEETIDDPEKGLIVKKSVKTVKRGTPKWAIDRVLGEKVDLLEIIKTLCDLGAITSEKLQAAEAELGGATSRILASIINGNSLGDDESEEENY